MTSVLLKAGACLVAAGFGVALWWASSDVKKRDSVDCEATREFDEQLQVGMDLAARHKAGSTLQNFTSDAESAGFSCFRVCGDGSAKNECKPVSKETISVLCRDSKDTKYCRHTVCVSGRYADDVLNDRLDVKVLSRKQNVLSEWFE